MFIIRRTILISRGCPPVQSVNQAVPGSYDSNDGKTIVWTAPSDYSYYYILTKCGQGNGNIKDKNNKDKKSNFLTPSFTE
jgi:hypothetical protein